MTVTVNHEMGENTPLLVYLLAIITVTLALTVFGANFRAALFLLYLATRDDID